MEKMTINLTKKQLSLIREYIDEKGYTENSGRRFYLITQPRVCYGKLDILLLTEKQGDELGRYFVKVLKIKK